MGKRVDRLRCSGKWTEAQYRNFIRSALRAASRKWGPIHETRKDAWASRGKYRCAGCKKQVPPTKLVGNKRQPNIFVDHITPVVDPQKGFETWDKFINNLFCEKDNLQLLCRTCHDKKTTKERKRGKSN